MKIVAFLQNLWTKDPQRTARLFANHPDRREYILRCLLFQGGKTGRILRGVLGEILVNQIIWEESTKQIAGDPKGVFPPDYEHIKDVLTKHKPDAVLALGKVATNAVLKVNVEMMPSPILFQFFSAPHPCARPAQDPLGALAEIKLKLEPYLNI